MPIPLTKDNKGWSSSWFYVKNHGEAPLPAFSGRFLTDKPPVWEYGPEKEEQEKLSGLLAAIKLMKNRGLTGAGVVGANHKRRVAPILVRALPLDEMKPGASADAVTRTVMVVGEISNAEITLQLWEAFNKPYPVFPIPDHPVMHPEPGFV